MVNYINFLFLLTAFFCFAACTKTKTPLPIEEKKLKEILIDVHIAEAALQPIVGLKKDSLQELYFSQIFEIHEVHPIDFEASMEILQANSKEMKRIYRELTEEIKLKKEDYKKEVRLKEREAKKNSKSHQDTLSR